MEAVIEMHRTGTDDVPALRNQLAQASRRLSELEAEVTRLRTTPSGVTLSYDEMRLREVEGVLVKKAMTRFQGNVSRAARALGLSRSALYRRLQRHGL
jgi:transcriptional regulator of acetoin/glycerol metabolism